MGDEARIQILEDVLKDLCAEIEGTFGGVEEKINPFSGATFYVLSFGVEGPLYDLEGWATVRGLDDIELDVYVTNAVRIRKVREIRREVAITEAPSGGDSFRPDLKPKEIQSDEDFQQAIEQVRGKFLDHCYPLQTLEELVEDIRRVKGTPD